ncbi:MAG: integrase [Candidatus Promineifilaceae bacterium]|jgi:integrase
MGFYATDSLPVQAATPRSADIRNSPMRSRRKRKTAHPLGADRLSGYRYYLAEMRDRGTVYACREASGLDIIATPHTSRRSCTTELLRSGANMYHVKELLGHESLNTLKHVARLTITDLKATHRKCHPRERDL